MRFFTIFNNRLTKTEKDKNENMKKTGGKMKDYSFTTHGDRKYIKGLISLDI